MAAGDMPTQATPTKRFPLAPPVSECPTLWAKLLTGRLLQPPTKVGILARIGRFEILQHLGSGGMGVVFLARDPLNLAASNSSSASGFVALKIPRPELARHPRAIERFLAEAQRMHQFDHPNVVHVLEIGTSPGQPYLVMPHLRRGSLASRIHQQGPLPEPEGLRLARQVASALLHAHTLGVIHRDLKPANVLLDDRGHAVLTDFGLARTVFNDGITDVRSEHREGTAPYMSPAVARGEAEDTRCDIYGFGALLYEVLTGQPPYAGHDSDAVRRSILAGPPPPVRQLNPDASPGLACVATWAMARELRHRYAHMVDVLADLQRIEAGLDPCGPRGQSHPPSTPLRTARESAHRLTLLAAATASLLVIGLLLLHPFALAARTARETLRRHSLIHSSPTTIASHPTWLIVQDKQLLLLQAKAGATVEVVQHFSLPTLSTNLSGPNPIPTHAHLDLLADVDGDGGLDMLVRAGHSATGAFPLLACYNVQSGALRWSQHHPYGYLPPALLDLDLDGTSEVFVTTQGAPGEGCHALLLTANGAPLHATQLPHKPLSWHVRPADHGKGCELLVLDETAHCLALDSQLRWIRSLPISPVLPD